MTRHRAGKSATASPHDLCSTGEHFTNLPGILFAGNMLFFVTDIPSPKSRQKLVALPDVSRGVSKEAEGLGVHLGTTRMLYYRHTHGQLNQQLKLNTSVEKKGI